LQPEFLKTNLKNMADTVNNKLFGEFPGVSTEAWMQKVVADLKGADFDKKLVWRTNEGFNVMPFYRAEDLAEVNYLDVLPGEFPYTRGTCSKNNEWRVREDIRVTDAKEANKKALNVLGRGVDSLGFCFSKNVAITAEMFETLLDNICLPAVEINFSVPKGNKGFLSLFVAYVEKHGYAAADVRGSINFDPMGRYLKHGYACSEKGDIEPAYMAEMLKAAANLPHFRVITVNARHFANAGTYIAQELGYGLAMGAEYMTMLTDAGVSAYDAAKNIKFSFAISSNYFMEIAKFRAARMLWAKIVEAYKPSCECGEGCNCKKDDKCCSDGVCKCVAKMKVHAETAKFNLSLYDPYVNMLRTQTEAMSAAIAGVDSMTVLPFDVTYKASDDLSERVARNQQLLLKEECNIEKIVDASAGSYYIEKLTASIADQAWSIFTSVAENGGFVASLKDGSIQKAVKASAAKRRDNIARRKEILLGTNQYPNFNEKMAGKIEETGCCCGCGEGKKVVEPLEFFRSGEIFEGLRIDVEKSGKQPKVFMLKLGNVAMRQARAQFSANFFACAGYGIIEDLGHKTIEDGVAAAIVSKAEIVVICASDDDYAEMALPAYEQLKNQAIFVVAGAPACADALKEGGIENFISVKSNVLETLKGYNKMLSI